MDMRKQLQRQGAEIPEDRWENTTLSSKKELPETAGRALCGSVTAEARTDEVGTRITGDGMGSPLPPAPSTKDMIAEAREQGRREGLAENARRHPEDYTTVCNGRAGRRAGPWQRPAETRSAPDPTPTPSAPGWPTAKAACPTRAARFCRRG